MSAEKRERRKNALKRERESGNLDAEEDEAELEPGVVVTCETGSL